MIHFGEERGWFCRTGVKKKRAAIPAANWILIKQRRHRGFRTIIYEAESAQHKNRRIRARHQQLRRLLILVIGCSLVQGDHALDQEVRNWFGLTTQMALYPGFSTLGNLLFPRPCSADRTTKKYIGISEINSHGPGDTHVRTKMYSKYKFLLAFLYFLFYRLASL